ncbi:MAG: F0F1 ATP synthase subunit alpha [Deltaproteobacteria bacterium]|nr:F0F1 ATP synthase subunit alpha [Deltaproteobacteria bacterium]
MLEKSLEEQQRAFAQALAGFKPELAVEDLGRIVAVNGPIVRAVGLASVGFEELVQCEDGTLGMVADLGIAGVGIILLGQSAKVRAGMTVKGLRRVADVAVGHALLGRVFNAAGKPLDEKGPLGGEGRRPLERPAPAIMMREPVVSPLETGIKVVDTLIPIGKGQRELILGDRQTGKTALALDAICNQRGKEVICIYAAIGQRESAMARVLNELEKNGALAYTLVLVAGGEEGPGLQFITPYAATAIGEYFMEQGRDVLIVYDDLTRHARVYRELSLLLERPPGREAYPGDIFYIHSRLLERSTHLRPEFGGGSMTALPIIETEEQNLSSYIPTNLISITDGQIYLSPQLFAKGMLPAVDVGKSVSRVGGKAQKPAFRDLVGELKLSYAQFEELETFARFATRLDDTTRQSLERGRRLRELLRQKRYQPRQDYEQIIVMLALINGLFDPLAVDQVAAAEAALCEAATTHLTQLCARIGAGETLNEIMQKEILDVCRQLLPPADKVA